MNLELDGKVALVTASSGGIGFEIARSLAAEGASVAINGRTQVSVDQAIENLGNSSPLKRTRHQLLLGEDNFIARHKRSKGLSLYGMYRRRRGGRLA